MQSGDITGKFALLTRQELVYLSGGLPELTSIQKSKINYKIKKKLEIFEKVELPLLIRAGFKPRPLSLSVENSKDCHSLDPGSKFGLEKKPNGHPGPGAFLTSFSNNAVCYTKNRTETRVVMTFPIPDRIMRRLPCRSYFSTYK